jgi:hypothetical protein
LDQGLVECGALPGYFAHLVARKTTAIPEKAIRAGVHPQGRLYKLLKTGRDSALGVDLRVHVVEHDNVRESSRQSCRERAADKPAPPVTTQIPSVTRIASF